MNVDDLYIIIRELRQIAILQASSLEILGADKQQLLVAHQEQKKANQLLQNIIKNYEQYNI